jgi:MerR family transcriptional regulator, thiopeptide resistance regulator
LAAATGLTVRALRHYDEIGLLRAGERTSAGHRRYTERDLHRLYRIRALRGLGLSLDEVAAVLDGPGGDLRGVLLAQLDALEQHARRAARLAQRLRELLGRLDDATEPDAEDFLTSLELMSMFESYFSQQQRDDLVARRDALGPEAVEAAQREWAALVTEGIVLVREDPAPDDARVRALLRRWDEIGARFHGADEGLTGAARTMWTDNAAELAGRLPWPPAELRALVELLGRARQVR